MPNQDLFNLKSLMPEQEQFLFDRKSPELKPADIADEFNRRFNPPALITAHQVTSVMIKCRKRKSRNPHYVATTAPTRSFRIEPVSICTLCVSQVRANPHLLHSQPNVDRESQSEQPMVNPRRRQIAADPVLDHQNQHIPPHVQSNIGNLHQSQSMATHGGLGVVDLGLGQPLPSPSSAGLGARAPVSPTMLDYSYQGPYPPTPNSMTSSTPSTSDTSGSGEPAYDFENGAYRPPVYPQTHASFVVPNQSFASPTAVRNPFPMVPGSQPGTLGFQPPMYPQQMQARDQAEMMYPAGMPMVAMNMASAVSTGPLRPTFAPARLPPAYGALPSREVGRIPGQNPFAPHGQARGGSHGSQTPAPGSAYMTSSARVNVNMPPQAQASAYMSQPTGPQAPMMPANNDPSLPSVDPSLAPTPGPQHNLGAQANADPEGRTIRLPRLGETASEQDFGSQAGQQVQPEQDFRSQPHQQVVQPEIPDFPPKEHLQSLLPGVPRGFTDGSRSVDCLLALHEEGCRCGRSSGPEDGSREQEDSERDGGGDGFG
ncbi:hypothetical protein B0T21DRAFT_419564 [Apiosordaria backusii]|uniref:Uncharacterized protein n=1 Tax=Apiosordaria backusii TaxID=314023 RepID=A0AA40EZ28_9PEZI|nr:hypothetical protein B0T21DRAFT_419564 [Apiosordaria backusii]